MLRGQSSRTSPDRELAPPHDHHPVLNIRDPLGWDHLADGEPLPTAAEGVEEYDGLDEAALVLQDHELRGQVVFAESREGAKWVANMLRELS